MQKINEILYTIGDKPIIIIGLISGVCSIISAIIDKKHRKFYIVGICVAILIYICSLYTSTLTTVPNVVGKYYNDACSMLTKSGLNYETISTPNDFEVIKQNIVSGKIVKRGTFIKLEIKNKNSMSTPSYTPNVTEAPTDTIAPTNKTTPTTTKIPTKTQLQKSKKADLKNTEDYKLMTCINKYRKKYGDRKLSWDHDLAQEAEKFAKGVATNKSITAVALDSSIKIIVRQCNGAENANKAVADWINGNTYIPSEKKVLLNKKYKKVGGALYYSAKGNKYGYHYFWVVLLK